MENEHNLDELIIRYLSDEISAEEAASVENWVNANAENRAYFDKLQKTWVLLSVREKVNNVDISKGWNRFAQNVAAEENKVVNIEEHEHFEGQYAEEETPVRKPVIYRILVATAIAASVLLIIGLGFKFFAGDKQDTPVAKNDEKRIDSLSFVVQHVVNTTGKEKRIILPDSSLIVLADNSEITYRNPFTDKRDVDLIGKAFFKVAKDKSRPFIVTSGDISTTALGTEFTVTALRNSNQIIVRLYEGKVVVKALEKTKTELKKNFYLLPGQAFYYGGQAIAKVNTFKLNTGTVPEEIINEELLRDDPSLPENAEGPYFMFNNQSLAQVFDILAEMYNVKIVYNKKEVENLYFIRRYKTTDSIGNILKEIARLNSLTVTRKDNTFVISK